jgi:hypothetical protein
MNATLPTGAAFEVVGFSSEVSSVASSSEEEIKVEADWNMPEATGHALALVSFLCSSLNASASSKFSVDVMISFRLQNLIK